MSDHLAKQIMYKDSTMRVPRYRYARIPLNNIPSGTVTVSPTSLTLLEWKVAASTCINLSRSFIASTWTVPALASNYGYSYENGCPFRTAYWGNGSGLGIVDLQFADCSVNTFRAPTTKYTDFSTQDQILGSYPCNQLNTSNILPFSRDGLSTGTENASTSSYTEQQYLYMSPTVNTALQLASYFPLSAFKKTFFASDQDTVYGTDMYIRLWTNYGQRMCSYTTTPSNPNGNNTQIVANITMSNMYLYLAVEENLDIRKSLLGALASGSIKLTIPYLYTYRFSNPGNTASCSVSLTLTKNYGRGVKSITVVPYNAQEYTNYAYDHSNVNGTKFQQIQCTMDGRPLTDYQLNCYNYMSSLNPSGSSSAIWSSPINWGDDYREQLKVLHGSAVTNYPQYQTSWFYQDSWGLLDTDADCNIPRSTITDSFDLLHSGDHIYSLSAQTPATQNTNSNCNANGLIVYLFVEFIRTLEIQSDGIVLSS